MSPHAGATRQLGRGRARTSAVARLPARWSHSLRTKRAIDVVGAWVGLAALALPSAVIAALIKTTSPGPVLYRQKRVGMHGLEFELIKFRTMLVGTHDEVLRHREQQLEYAENDFKLPADDPRITRVGRVLRKLSIDEIPQFVNVLRGEMSLVGIRPVERAQLEMRPVADQLDYTSMRPGLTGSWQIEGRSSIHPRARLALDRAYVASWSNWLDLRILLRTPLAVLHIARTR
jgi:lipopolysaccharide/colanic/teichoic acid biosynthesis glycosyltransferase